MNITNYLDSKGIRWSPIWDDLILIDASVIHQIDIDAPGDEMKGLLSKGGPYFLSKNKRLPHFFARLIGLKQSGAMLNFGNGDFLRDCSYARKDEVVQNADVDIPYFNFY